MSTSREAKISACELFIKHEVIYIAYKITRCGGLRYNTASFKEIDGVLTLASESVLVGSSFVAPMCGGIKLDSGVFKSVKVGDKDVITTLESATDSYMKAHCALLFDGDVFEIGYDEELTLVEKEAEVG